MATTGNSEFDPQLIVSHKFPEATYTYTQRDAALYALGVGACAMDAVDDKELKFVYHRDGQQYIQVLPTFAALFSIGYSETIAEIPGLRYNPHLLLHGQQYIEIYKPLPSSGSVINRACIAGLHDKGKAAVLEVEIGSYEKESGDLLCMNRHCCTGSLVITIPCIQILWLQKLQGFLALYCMGYAHLGLLSGLSLSVSVEETQT
ncbi:unnamed protein product [Cuscuta europaea]|uniref:Peroxisomal multifunctional enzyme type 2-like N-terminal domain-containing protein n=1 Tax=Cuscuta europaea TaxID=41803 RepID=A0A9P1EBX1_CUSEU|nr:unnamed protein product [Cuscuta europaea]